MPWQAPRSMENFNPCGIGQNIDYDYDNDSEGRAEQIVIVVVVAVAVDIHDINLTTGRRATGGRPFWRQLLLEIQFSIQLPKKTGVFMANQYYDPQDLADFPNVTEDAPDHLYFLVRPEGALHNQKKTSFFIIT
ncbi:MAG: hypothetical protein ACOCQT_05380 [Desulfovermiculus sp.]